MSRERAPPGVSGALLAEERIRVAVAVGKLEGHRGGDVLFACRR
jgi:hypothetical protein